MILERNEMNETDAPFRIGMAKERSLHIALKEWYALPGDQIEAKVDGFFIDIVRFDEQIQIPLLCEIQTGNFAAIRRKLDRLLPHYQIRLVYPVPQEKWIVKISVDGEIKVMKKTYRP